MYDHKDSPKPKITNLSHRHQQVLVVQAKGMLPPYAAAVEYHSGSGGQAAEGYALWQARP